MVVRIRKLEVKLPLVSIIVPTRNSQATIERCLMSIRQQDYANLEIIVVDNHSRDRTRELAEKYADKIFLKGPERGAQVNFGVEKAAGKYVYRVDSDFVLNSSVVSEAVAKSEQNGFDAIIVHNTSDPSISFWAKVRKMERDSYKNDELNVAARFWSKEAFLAVGGFDESLVAGDDYDLHNRLANRGFRFGRVKAEEVHIGEPKNLAEVFRKHYYYGKNIGFFVRKNQQRALAQLSPLRFSIIRGFKSSGKPALIAGFFVYQFLRYAAVGLGIFVVQFRDVT